MGPNLTRLFHDANNKSGSIPIDATFAAECQLKILLMTHGEALIAALERCVDCLDPTTALLSQLESEAQP